jgi:hypothetical protein
VSRAPSILLAGALALGAPLAAREADTPAPGFNLFTVQQDVEIGSQSANQGSRNPDTGKSDVRVDPPSSRFQKFEQRDGLFTIEHPDNWRA